jgi:hypothetical protein
MPGAHGDGGAARQNSLALRPGRVRSISSHDVRETGRIYVPRPDVANESRPGIVRQFELDRRRRHDRRVGAACSIMLIPPGC